MSRTPALCVLWTVLGCAPAAPPTSLPSAASGRAQAPDPCPGADASEADHRELFEQAKALENKELWTELEATLARAEELAPGFANYSFKRGHALIKLAETTTDPKARPSFYAQAIPPLRRCLASDPGYAECHHFLAEALLATKQVQAALEHYDRAIRRDATVAYFYPPYAEALIALKEYDAAARVIGEGVRLIPTTEGSRGHLYALHVLSFMVHQARDDRAGMIQALETAFAVDGERHPEMLFNLGSMYVTATPPDPRGREFMGRFFKRVCRGAAASKFADQCEVAQQLLRKLPP